MKFWEEQWNESRMDKKCTNRRSLPPGPPWRGPVGCGSGSCGGTWQLLRVGSELPGNIYKEPVTGQSCDLPEQVDDSRLSDMDAALSDMRAPTSTSTPTDLITTQL